MIPAKHDITIRRGDTFRLFFRLRLRDENGNPGTYPDLTTWGNGLAQVRSAIDGTVVWTMVVTKSNQSTYPGGILLTITDDLTKSAFPGTLTGHKWDFEIVNDLGETDTPIEGDVTLVKDVSWV